MAKEYIYLQGKFYLSKIANGVAGAMRFIGNVPEFEIAITADLIEHTESTSGKSTTDFTMVNTTGVEFSGQIEEINPENMEYILSGTNHEIASATVTDLNIGTVVASDEIMQQLCKPWQQKNHVGFDDLT